MSAHLSKTFLKLAYISKQFYVFVKMKTDDDNQHKLLNIKQSNNSCKSNVTLHFFYFWLINQFYEIGFREKADHLPKWNSEL
jgi:hypothetical protein